jgi:hypothetical protein
MFYFGCYLSAQAEMVNAFLQSRMAELMERFTVTLGDGTGDGVDGLTTAIFELEISL